MRTFRASKGPFREGFFLSDSEVENTCTDQLRNVNLLPATPAAIRIDRFIEKRFGFAPTYEDLPDGILGVTRFGSRGPQEIVVANALEADTSQPGQRRVRTTMAHEAGHALFHGHLFVLGEAKPLFGDWSDKNRPKVLCRDHERQTYQGEWWELHANMAMASLLMPSSLAYAAIENLMTPDGVLGGRGLPTNKREEAIGHLAEVFDVNPVMARYRLDKLVPSAKSMQLSL